MEKNIFESDLDSYKYDYDIRQIFNDTFGGKRFYFDELVEGTDDFQILRIGTEILKNARDRLCNSEDIKVQAEYCRLAYICEQLNDIIENYV